MAKVRRRGTKHAQLRQLLAVDSRKQNAAAGNSAEFPPDFNPAAHDGEPFDAAFLGDASVTLWSSVPLYGGYVEERKFVLPFCRSRFRL